MATHNFNHLILLNGLSNVNYTFQQNIQLCFSDIKV